jgi:catechol 1,2-dioxygenase
MRDLLEASMAIIVRHDISESEFWGAVNYLAQSGPEMGLLAAGTGLEHFMDLFLDAKDAEAGLSGGTPRTIEGPSMSRARRWSMAAARSISPTIPMTPRRC